MGFSKLTIVLGLDTKNFTRQLQTAKNKVTRSAQKMRTALNKVGFKRMAIAAAAAGAAVVLAMKKFAAAGDELDKMSLRTGIAVEDLSRLGHAAQISGTDIQTMKDALRFVAKNMDLAKRGMGEGAVAFKELGFKVTDANGQLRKVTDVLFTVADSMMAMENATSRSALAAQIFGQRYGEKLLPMLRLGSEGIRELMKDSDKLGITWSKLEADQAAKLTDQLTRMQGVLGGVGRSIVIDLVPAFIRLVDVVRDNKDELTQTAQSLAKILTTTVKIVSFVGSIPSRAVHNIITSGAVHQAPIRVGFEGLRARRNAADAARRARGAAAAAPAPGFVGLGGIGAGIERRTAAAGSDIKARNARAQIIAAGGVTSPVSAVRQPIDEVTANIRTAQAVWMDFQGQVQFGWESTIDGMLRGTVRFADVTKRLLNDVLSSFISAGARFAGQQLFGATLGRFSTGAQVGVAQISNLTTPTDPITDVIRYGGSSNG